MSSNPTALRALRAVFGNLAPGQGWELQLQRADRLRTLIEANLPSGLAAACVAWLEGDGVLVLACANGAVAAKLKQLTPRLLLNFRKSESQISSIRVEVQAMPQAHDASQKTARKLTPPASAALDLEQTATQVRAPELAAAMRRLAGHLRGSGD